MANEAASAAHAGKTVANEALDVLCEYIAPLAGGIVGVVAGSTVIGGTYSICNAINSVGQGKIDGTRVGGFVSGVIWAGIGYGFWGLRKRGGWILKLIGGGVGGLFFGYAAQSVFVAGVGDIVPTQGPLDRLFDWAQGEAGGK